MEPVASCLADIRVLELGSTIAGPSAARHLSDLGAIVMKVEPPSGDQLRTWGTIGPDGTSYWFKSHNRGKQLLSFDLRDAADAATVREIALSADIVIENFRPGWLAQYGLDAVALRGAKPSLIYVSISGYGQTGPMASQPGYGSVAEALGGFRHITGEPDGPPMRLGVSIADEIAGLYAALAAIAALHARNRDSIGETVDVSLIESVFSLLEGVLPEYKHAGKIAARTGNRLGTTAPSNVYPTADGRWIAIAGNGESIFRRLASAMSDPTVASNARFANNQARVANVTELDDTIAAWTSTRTLADLSSLLADAGVPAGPILSIQDIVDHPQFQARNAIRSIHDEVGTEVATYGPVPHLVERPITLGSAAGAIGRDQAQVLAELGR